MTDPQWILHGPGKHDRAVCDTAETWGRIFKMMCVGLAATEDHKSVQEFAFRNRRVAKEACDAIDDEPLAQFVAITMLTGHLYNA